MTSKDLTEQWKNGKLEDACYYVKIKRPDMFYMLSREDNHWYEFGSDCWFFDNDIAEIVAEIPSYEKWEQLQNWADFTSDYHELREKIEIAEYKNAELKEDYNRLGKLLQKMEDSDNAREKFQNGQIEKLKELLKECKPYVNHRFMRTREILTKPYTASDKVLHKKAEKLLTKIDEVLK